MPLKGVPFTMADILIHSDIIDLLYKRIQAQELSAREHQQLEAWGARSPEHASLIRDLGTDVFLVQAIRERYQLKKEAGWEKIKDTLEASGEMWTPVRPVAFFRRNWVRYAAAALIVLAMGIYWWERGSHGENAKQPVMAVTDIGPGSSGAVLTLADGTEVVLDSLGNGVVANEHGSTVRLRDGQLDYDPSETATGSIVYNIMRTPKGRQFSITLPDGTKVWLNAASSLKYPTSFTGTERRVELTGEGYFEVAPDKRKPFFVKAGDGAEIKVLGTKFNVNAYHDEPGTNTTLLEGHVRVNNLETGEPAVLQPGQQAQLSERKTTINNTPDIEKVMAWKNGRFNFEGADLKETMRQLERWYNIEVVYEGAVPDVRFFGKMSRKVNLSTVLTALKGFGLKFRFTEDGKLIVSP